MTRPPVYCKCEAGLVSPVQPLADARGSYDAIPERTSLSYCCTPPGPHAPLHYGTPRAARVRVCEKIRGSIQWPRCTRVLRAATVRERWVVTPVQPLAYARGS